jgi:peptidoglycan/LPS O-acetylase OafA/YrhL
MGFLRLVFAVSVLVNHAVPLGFGKLPFGMSLTHGQTAIGQIALRGFFVISGFLIAGSAMKFAAPRYLWHRFLRIFPGLWVSMLVTALLIAPVAHLYERGTLAGFWSHPHGPFQYLAGNWTGGIQQWAISDLLSTTPFGQINPWGGSAFSGSLWFLVYALICYAFLAVLAAAGVLRRAPWVVVLLTVGVFSVTVFDYLRTPGWFGGAANHGAAWLPLVGLVKTDNLLSLGLVFLIGVLARLYQDRLPMHGAIAGAATIVLLGSLMFGGFHVVGVPALAYVVLWAAIALPKWSHGIGRRRDYSFGIYLYGFAVQQLLALFGVPRFGFVAYVALTIVITTILAAASWHFVERRAMSFKNARLKLPRPGRSLQPIPATETAGT